VCTGTPLANRWLSCVGRCLPLATSPADPATAVADCVRPECQSSERRASESSIGPFIHSPTLGKPHEASAEER
jgi:hypothetical protein